MRNLISLGGSLSLGGGTFDFGDLVPHPVLWIVILGGSEVGAVLSALAGLRSVRATPLGVVRAGRRRRPALRRLLVLILAWVAFIATIPLSGQYWTIVLGLGLVILNISTVGPLFAWFLGWILTKASRRPRTLMAGRRLMADPVTSFRPTTGLILVSFVAGFLLLSNATLPESGVRGDALLLGYPDGPIDEATMAHWEDDLTAAYPGAEFQGAWDQFSVVLPEDFDLESERAAIEGITGSMPLTGDEARYEYLLFAEDVRTATWVVVTIALIQAAFATGVGAAASVLEQARTLAALNLAGTTASDLQASRAWQATVPITVGSAIFTVLGAAAGAVTIIGVRPLATITIPSFAQAGLVVVLAAAAALVGIGLTGPLVRSVLRRPLAER